MQLTEGIRVPGRHHHEPHPDPCAPAPPHGRLTLALGAVAIVGGGAMIGGWTILTGGGRDDPRAITVQPSAAPTAPPATLDGSAGGDLFVSTPPSDPSTVVLTYPSGKRITVTGSWNATPTATGRRLSFDGGPLAPGASYTFGFQAVNAKSGDVNPDACTINGTACAGF